MPIDNTSTSLIATAIGAIAAIAGSLLTQFFSSRREEAQENRAKQKEFFETKKLAYLSLRNGIDLYRLGNADNEELKSALAWIELFAPEGIRQYVKDWKRLNYKPQFIENLLWTHIRSDLVSYYGKPLPSHYFGALEFIWHSAIFRTWATIGAIWISTIKSAITSHTMQDWIFNRPELWPMLFAAIALLLLFIMSGHTQLIYYGWWSEIGQKSMNFAKDYSTKVRNFIAKFKYK